MNNPKGFTNRIITRFLLLLRRAASPLRQLAEWIEALGEGHVHSGAPAGRLDEPGLSGQTFAQMDEDVKSSREALRLANLELEKRVEERTAELEASEERFRKVFDAVPVPLLISRASDGLMLEANDRFAPAMGLSPDGVVGQKAPDFYDDPADRRALLAELSQQGFVHDRELRIRRADGIVRWILSSMQQIDYGGEAVILTGFQDITRRKEAQEAVRRSEERFKALVQNAVDAVTILDAEGNIVYESPPIERIVGYTPAERAGTNAFGNVHPDDLPLLQRAFGEVLEAPGKTVWAEMRVRHKDGSWRIIEATGTNLLHDPAVEGIVANWHDVTEQREYERLLRENEERFRLVFTESPIGKAIVNLDFRIERVNPHLLEFLGYAEEELIGQSFVDFSYPEDRGAVLDQTGKLRNREISRFQIEKRFVTKGGEPRWVSLSGAAVRNQAGDLLYFLMMAEDIQQRKELDQALRRFTEELQRSNQELEQFAYVASHDLQEPLRMVTSYLQLIKQRYQGQLDEDADEFIHYAVDGANRMKMLIQDLLSFSRVGTRGRLPEPVDSEEAIERVLSDLQPVIAETGAQITHDPLPTVQADPTQFHQLLSNLIGNAIKFRGNDSPRIHMGAQREDDGWLFSVRDNGIGFDASEYGERIFVIFQRLHTKTEYGGTGIGLALCKKIVERHGGRIWVESQPGEGATFYFTLPDRKTEEPHASTTD